MTATYTADDAPHPDLIGREVCPAELLTPERLKRHKGDAEAAGRELDADLAAERTEQGLPFFYEGELIYDRLVALLDSTSRHPANHVPTGTTAPTPARATASRRTSASTARAPARSTRRKSTTPTGGSPAQPVGVV